MMRGPRTAGVAGSTPRIWTACSSSGTSGTDCTPSSQSTAPGVDSPTAFSPFRAATAAAPAAGRWTNRGVFTDDPGDVVGCGLW